MFIFSECTSAQDVHAFISDNHETRSGFCCHYTSHLDQIFKHSTLWLTNFANAQLNDPVEKRWYAKEGKNMFAICFSRSSNESIPMYYLYSGIDGRGGRIEFQKGAMELLLREPHAKLVEIGEKNKPIATHELRNGNDYSIKYRNILYVEPNVKSTLQTKCKYMTRAIKLNKADTDELLHFNNDGFTKNYIWNYENEVRLRIEIMNYELRKMIENKNRHFVVEISISDIITNTLVRFGPELKDDEQCRTFTEQYGVKAELSNHCGQVEMGLGKSGKK